MHEVTLLPFYLLLLKVINFNSNEAQGITTDQLHMNLPPTLEHCITKYTQFYLSLSIFSSTSLITFHFAVAIADSLPDSHSDSHMNKNIYTFITSDVSWFSKLHLKTYSKGSFKFYLKSTWGSISLFF